MKRLARILAALIGMIVVLIILAVVLLPLFFDPNAHKGQIAALIEEKIGREVTIPGEIELSVFPWLGISIGEVHVANAPDFGDEPLAEIAAANLHVKLLPLLQRQVELGTISLDGLHLRLARDTEGQTNWGSMLEHMAHAQDSPQAGAATERSDDDAGGGFELQSLEIEAIKVSDAIISWNDAMTSNSYRLSDFDLSTGRIARGEPIAVTASSLLAAHTQGFSSDISLTASILPDPDTDVYKFSDLELGIKTRGDAVPGGSQELRLTGQGVYDMNEAYFTIDDLAIEVAGLEMSGHMRGEQLAATPVFSGKIKVAQFEPRAVLQELGVELPELQGDRAAEGDSNVLASAGLEIEFNAGSTSANIERLQLQLDDSTLTGTASITDFAAPAIAFDMNVDHFNLDRYLPVAAEEAQPPDEEAGEEEGAEPGATEFDLSVLQDLELDGKFRIDRLVAYRMTFDDAELAVSADEGVLTIKPLASGFYDGLVNIVARVDSRENVPRYDLQAKLSNLRFAPLLEDLVGSDALSALADMQLDLSSSGSSLEAIKRALDGNIRFNFSDGAFYGFNLEQMIAQARSRFEDDKAALGDTEVEQKTPFSHFSGDFEIHNGTVAGKDFNIETRRMDIDGAGQYDLAANDLNYTLGIELKEQEGRLAELEGLTIPLHLSGSLLAPDYSIDIAAAVEELVEQRLQEKKDEAQEKLQDKKDELRDKLEQKLDEKLPKGLSDFLQR